MAARPDKIECRVVPETDGASMGLTFVNELRHTIRTVQWLPPAGTEAQALFFFIPGYLDHSLLSGERKLGGFLVQHKIAMFSLDKQGHGLSDGLRGYFDFPVQERDILFWIDSVRKLHPGKKYFVGGHSLGGLLTLRTGLKLKADPLFTGAVVLAPLLMTPEEPPGCVVTMLVAMAKCCPTLACICVPAPPVKFIYKDASFQAEHTEHPLFTDVATRLGPGAGMFNAFSYTREHLSEIDFPYLLIHGDADKICKVQGARNLFQQCKSKKEDYHYVELKGAYHDLLHDPPYAEDNRKEIVRFLLARLAGEAVFSAVAASADRVGDIIAGPAGDGRQHMHSVELEEKKSST